MEFALVALAGIGVLLFLFSYLAYILAGFRHHPVTGIIAIFPVLNIVTLPSLWHVTGRKLILGVIGLLLIVGSWYFGAEQSFNNLLARYTNTGVIISQQSSNEEAAKAQSLLESNMQGLPGKALYKLAFDVVDINQIGSLQGKTINILTKDSENIEGRLMKIINTKAFLDSQNAERSIELTDIKQLSVMVKK